jgi:hypothetical protein
LNEHIAGLIGQYARRGLLLDSVLFVLLAIGAHNRGLVGSDKRLRNYAPGDVDTLIAFIALFKPLVTIPNIVTEVNNLTGHLWNTKFPLKFTEQIELMEEHYFPSNTATRSQSFERYGLTDAAIAEIAKGRFLVLTDDLRLAGHLEGQKVDVINFNHVRALDW